MAVRQLDRSTATFKQLVEHADARERLKADEEKRMRVSCTMRLQSNSLRPMVALWNGLQILRVSASRLMRRSVCR